MGEGLLRPCREPFGRRGEDFGAGDECLAGEDRARLGEDRPQPLTLLRSEPGFPPESGDGGVGLRIRQLPRIDNMRPFRDEETRRGLDAEPLGGLAERLAYLFGARDARAMAQAQASLW